MATQKKTKASKAKKARARPKRRPAPPPPRQPEPEPQPEPETQPEPVKAQRRTWPKPRTTKSTAKRPQQTATVPPAENGEAKQRKPQLSRLHKPASLSLEDWQIELRRQFGRCLLGDEMGKLYPLFEVVTLGVDGRGICLLLGSPLSTPFPSKPCQCKRLYRVSVTSQ